MRAAFTTQPGFTDRGLHFNFTAFQQPSHLDHPLRRPDVEAERRTQTMGAHPPRALVAPPRALVADVDRTPDTRCYGFWILELAYTEDYPYVRKTGN